MNDKSPDKNEQQEMKKDLLKLINEVQQGNTDEEGQKQDKTAKTAGEPDLTEKIDILNLPPRKEVHTERKGKINLKISRPLVRLLFVIILLLLIVAGAYFLAG